MSCKRRKSISEQQSFIHYNIAKVKVIYLDGKVKIQRGFYLLTILNISIQCVFYLFYFYEQHQILLSLEDLIFKFEHSILILILTLYYWSQVGRAPCSSVSITVIERLGIL